MNATHELTTGELHQVVKSQANQRRRMRFKDRKDGEQKLRPVFKRDEPLIDDDELAGIDLRRIKTRSDLDLE